MGRSVAHRGNARMGNVVHALNGLRVMGEDATLALAAVAPQVLQADAATSLLAASRRATATSTTAARLFTLAPLTLALAFGESPRFGQSRWVMGVRAVVAVSRLRIAHVEAHSQRRVPNSHDARIIVSGVVAFFASVAPAVSVARGRPDQIHKGFRPGLGLLELHEHAMRLPPGLNLAR